MLGNLIAIDFAVVLLAGLLVTSSLKVTPFGLDFVPALVGETEDVTSMLGSGVWAMATPAVVLSTSVATPATRKDLRKELLLRRGSFDSGLRARDGIHRAVDCY